MKKNSMILIIVVAVLIGVLFIFMPEIYKWTIKLNTPKVVSEKKSTKKKTVEKFDESKLDDLVYPNMHVNSYEKNTYYSLASFTMDKMSNNDILANAFEQIYTGYIVSNGPAGCATEGKKINSSYLVARIKNTLGLKIKYQFSDFNVYNSKYPGLWKYDAASKGFIYNGNCNNNGSARYYDIHYMTKYETSNDNKTLNITAKVAFVKVENNNYVIYQNYDYTNELDKGVFTDLDSLTNKLNKLSAKTYKYIFKQGICSYEAYCLESGSWING